ncbi:hypothetical protein [Tenacibaculum agarivorans]|uniref:hypothetical protein n=1 Tax=Tenacibaculum agarivorans TaxID=1908389 RepID=UPI00094B804C|nr:hypothetical protein [Tenacibaculum agarivorans]
MKSYLTINWNKMLLWMVPSILRKQKHLLLLQTFLEPLFNLYQTNLYKTQHSGQVIYLEKVLNEQFNPEKKYDPNYSTQQKKQEELIYIAESLKPSLQHIYLHEEHDLGYEAPLVYKRNEVTPDSGKGMYLVGVKDYTEIEYANFRIMIPESLNIKEKLDGIEGAEKIQKLTNELYFTDNANSQHQELGPVDVKTSKFHELIRFYKLAGKTYETYKY